MINTHKDRMNELAEDFRNTIAEGIEEAKQRREYSYTLSTVICDDMEAAMIDNEIKDMQSSGMRVYTSTDLFGYFNVTVRW